MNRARRVLRLGLVGQLCAFGAATSLSCRSTSTEVPFDLGKAGLETLSGSWMGTFHVKKTGRCNVALRLDKRFATSGVTHRIRAEWRVEPDGSFQMREFVDDASKPDEWSGAVDDSLRVQGLLVAKVTCGNAEHEDHTSLRGRVLKGDSGPVLRLSGQDNMCPDSGCVFELRYELSKEK